MGRGQRRAAYVFAVVVPLAAFQAAAQERTTAVWKEQDIGFLYRSSNVIYECGALRDRVAAILYAVGARGDVQVKVDNCDHFIAPEQQDRRTDRWENPIDRYRSGRLGSDPFNSDRTSQQSANVRIHLASPVEVTPKVLEEVKKEKSRRELIARVTGDRSGIQEATGQFPAEWQKVTLSRSSIGLEPEDCELLDQMSSSVFRKLGIREVSRGVACNPRQVSQIPPKLTVEALISAPYGSSPAREKPSTDEQEAHPNTPAPSGAEPSEPSDPKPGSRVAK